MAKIRTSVDELMELVKKETKIPLPKAAKQLGVHEKTVQSWVDFLVEEHILGIEYKFTTPYIYVQDEERLERAKKRDENYTLKDFKNGFYAKARDKDIPEEQIPHMWREHLRYTLQQHKQHFIDECKRRGVPEPADLYEEYEEEVLHEA